MATFDKSVFCVPTCICTITKLLIFYPEVEMYSVVFTHMN